ncbi:RNA-guided pseudouridylation complex pseudouridine synthase subunit Cbf5 [Sulfurisphaera javensis]|uniref:RNA-guided pseudouridylation complex pseudouridine synthase subunit Cbf5 n=1 Tax=Sulfurisphaera javensis TaxID=2049879 RepID=A0AAT9GRK9_9CREN
MNYISSSGKEYVCLMQVHCHFDFKELENILKKFIGTIYQKPPVRSSVKRRTRKRNVYNIEILDHEGKFVLLKISSDPGTYMRKICHDVGIILGCGAHMRELRRIRSGIFTEKNLVTLQEVSEALYMWKNCKDETDLRKLLLPEEFATCGIPKVIIDDNAVNAITYGAMLTAPGIVAFQNFKSKDNVAILTLKGELVAIGEAEVNSSQILNMKKGIVIRPKRVIMPRDIYPRSWKKHEQ